MYNPYSKHSFAFECFTGLFAFFQSLEQNDHDWIWYTDGGCGNVSAMAPAHFMMATVTTCWILWICSMVPWYQMECRRVRLNIERGNIEPVQVYHFRKFHYHVSISHNLEVDFCYWQYILNRYGNRYTKGYAIAVPPAMLQDGKDCCKSMSSWDDKIWRKR